MILSEVINHKTTYVSFMTYYIDCRPGQCLPSVLVTSSGGSVVEHPLREWEVVGSALGRAIPKVLKWYKLLTCVVLSILRQKLACLLTNTTQLTSQNLQKQFRKLFDNNQCLYSSED